MHCECARGGVRDARSGVVRRARGCKSKAEETPTRMPRFIEVKC
jgi:hypothetical protein